MENTIVSLFIAFVLWSINIGFIIRYSYAFLRGKERHKYMTRTFKPIDCFPCFSFWIACIVSLVTNFEILPIMATYIIANFYEQYKD